jgi:DNA-binding response OmpR family regulator
MATQPPHDSHQARQYTLLIASTDPDQRTFLAAQLDADGHTMYEADNPQAAIARLSAHAIDLMVLGRLHRPADAPALLRALRAGEHPRIHPGQPVITLGTTDELAVLRAYEAGSDHHLPDTAGYLLLRAVMTSVLRRTVEAITSRHLHIAGMHIDLAARTVDIDGAIVRPSPIEFELLVAFASDPVRIFNRDDLAHSIWNSAHISGRTVDSHVCACAPASSTPARGPCSSTAGATAGR